MTAPLLTSNRTFRVWLYAVSHGTLLLRSVKDARRSTRVDVVFKPVAFMSLPTTFEGLEIRASSAVELEAARPGASRLVEASDHVFAVSTRGITGWVVSAVMAFHEDQGSDFDASHFSVPRMV